VSSGDLLDNLISCPTVQRKTRQCRSGRPLTVSVSDVASCARKQPDHTDKAPCSVSSNTEINVSSRALCLLKATVAPWTILECIDKTCSGVINADIHETTSCLVWQTPVSMWLEISKLVYTHPTARRLSQLTNQQRLHVGMRVARRYWHVLPLAKTMPSACVQRDDLDRQYRYSGRSRASEYHLNACLPPSPVPAHPDSCS